MFNLKMAAIRLLTALRNTANSNKIAGIEKWFDVSVVLLRFASFSYWLKGILPDPVHKENRAFRDIIIEGYVLLQLIILIILFTIPQIPSIISCGIGVYILFEMFLNLFSILFLGKLSEVNAPPASTERSLLLFIINAFQLILCFAIFYRASMGLCSKQAFVNAVLVLGTVGHPLNSSFIGGYIVVAQIFLDFIFVLLFVGAFASQYKVFNNKSESNQK